MILLALYFCLEMRVVLINADRKESQERAAVRGSTASAPSSTVIWRENLLPSYVRGSSLAVSIKKEKEGGDEEVRKKKKEEE